MNCCTITESEFLEKWGHDEIYFHQEKTFSKMFGFGFSLWIDAGSYRFDPFKSSWSKKIIHFILSREQVAAKKISLHDELTVVLDTKYVETFTCSVFENCGYTTSRLFNLKRHEKQCTDQTKIIYEEKSYGNHDDTREELIKLKIIPTDDESEGRFVSFDIESVNATVSEEQGSGVQKIVGSQEVVTIGYAASFNSQKGVFVRKDMTRQSGREQTWISQSGHRVAWRRGESRAREGAIVWKMRTCPWFH